MIKRVLLVLLGLLLISQLAQPDRSVPTFDPANDMLAVTKAAPGIQQLVIGACYDCHSYKTEYPWYAHLTPVNFIMQDINEGREIVNFSLWDRYATNEETGESAETIQEGEMPPGYYSFMHAHGRLNAADKQTLVDWFTTNVPEVEGGGGEGGGGEEEHED